MTTESEQIPHTASDLDAQLRLLQVASDAVEDALFVKDTEGRYLFCNPAGARFIGRSIETVIGHDDSEFFGAEAAKGIQAQDRRVMSTRMTESENRRLYASGEHLLFRVTKSPYIDNAGNVIGVVGVARDITRKQEAESALIRQQQILEHVASGVPLPEILSDLVTMIEEAVPGVIGSFLLMSPDGKRLNVIAAHGLPEAYNSAVDGLEIGPAAGSCGTAACTGAPVFVDDIASDPLWDSFRSVALKHGLRACWSTPIFSRREQDRRVLGTFAVYSRQPGPPDSRLVSWIQRTEHLACIAIDNSRAVQRLQESEARFRTFVENTVDAFFLLDSSGKVLDVNQQGCSQLGAPREQIIGGSAFEPDPAVTPEWLSTKSAFFAHDERVIFEARQIRKDGVIIPVEVRLSPFRQGSGQDRFAVASVHDISHRRKTEDTIRKLGDFRESIIRTAAEGICVCYSVPEYPYVRFSVWYERMTLLTGYTMSEINQLGWYQMLYPDPDTQKRALTRMAAMRFGKDLIAEEWEITRKDGEVRSVSISTSLLTIEGETRAVVATIQDVTDRRRAEAVRLEGERRFRELADAIPQIAWVADPTGALIHLNARTADYTGVNVGELTGWSWDKVIHPDDLQGTIERWTEATTSGIPRDIELRIQRADGEFRWHIAREVPIRDASGNILRWYGTCTDIAELKAAEQALRESEARFRHVLDYYPSSVYLQDLEGRYLFVNRQAALDGLLKADQWKGKNVSDVFPEKTAEIFEEQHRRVVATLSPCQSEHEVALPGGSTACFLSVQFPLFSSDGTPYAICMIATDITDRRKTEETVRHHVSRLQATLESTADGILVVDLNGRIVDLNKQFLSFWDFPAELIAVGKKEDLVSSFNDDRSIGILFGQLKDPEGFAARVREIYAAPEEPSFDVVEFRNGRILERFSQPQRIDGKPVGRVWSFRDVTKRRAAERSLRLTQFSIDRAVDSVFWVNPEGEILYVNEAACRTLGYSQTELIGRRIPDIDANFSETSWPAHWEEIKRRGSFTFESTHTTSHGKILCTEVTVNYLQYEDQEYNCAVMRDITDRKKAEEERDRLWNHSMDPLCIAGFDGYLKHINPAWERCLGWSEQELLSRPWIELVHSEDREATIHAGRRLARGESVAGFENRYRCRDGSYRWLAWNSISNPEIQTIYASARDVTNVKHLSEQLRQSQKLEAIGRLAGGVAHDFNNLLTVINGYAELLLTSFSAREEHRDSLLAVRDAGERATRLTAQLLAFSRKAIIEPKVLDLNAETQSVIRMLRRLIGEDISISTRLSPNLFRVCMDPGQVEQVLVNLALNARDAMPQGGVIEIETQNHHRSEAASTLTDDFPPGDYVQLMVSDTGEGISSEILPLVFEPFFTTKGVSKGTGLGLATVYGIVRQAGGCISVESTVGLGSTFHIFLPAVQDSDSFENDPASNDLPRGTETVLLAEDEEPVRKLVSFALRIQGYTVLEAVSGDDALHIASSHPGPIHLLLTDVVMPAPGGRELTDRIRRIHEDIRVVYMSGCIGDAMVRQGVETSPETFLQKPFTPLTLARKVRDALDAPDSPGNHRSTT